MKKDINNVQKYGYNFDATKEYYDQRPENDIVGIIDKNVGQKDIYIHEELNDIFKIRNTREKILVKRRGVGIPTVKGAVCKIAKDKRYLENIANKLGIKVEGGLTRGEICDLIQNKLLELEKYSTDGKTYVMIPINHPKYEFPYNLKDRVNYIIKKIKNVIKTDIDFKINKESISGGKIKYNITFSDSQKISPYKQLIESSGAILKDNTWTINVN